MNGTIFSSCLTSAISALQAAPKPRRKQDRKEQEKKELRLSQCQWWIWCQRLRECLRCRWVRVHRTAGGYSKHKVTIRVLLPVEGNLHRRIQIKAQHRVLSVTIRCTSEFMHGETRCRREDPEIHWRRLATQFPDIPPILSDWAHEQSILEHAAEIWPQPRLRIAHTSREFVDWWMFMSATMGAALHLGKNYQNNLQIIKNTKGRTLKQFDVTQKLILDQEEISGISKILWDTQPWEITTLRSDTKFSVRSFVSLILHPLSSTRG